MNLTHPFWKDGKSSLKLSGYFIENCLWTPDLTFASVHEIKASNPTPTKVKGSPYHYSLDQNGKVYVWMQNVDVTASCSLDFGKFPFDKQVYFL